MWILAGAGIAGMLIGPLGLFLLRQVLKRIGAVGARWPRLARHDTSVEIPDLASGTRLANSHARSPCSESQVDRALHRRPSWNGSTCNSTLPSTRVPLGLSMFDAQDRLLVCNTRYAEMYRLPGEFDGARHRSHCAPPGPLEQARRAPPAERSTDAGRRRGARHSADDDRAGPMHASLPSRASRSKGGGWVALHEDVTEKHRQEQGDYPSCPP